MTRSLVLPRISSKSVHHLRHTSTCQTLTARDGRAVLDLPRVELPLPFDGPRQRIRANARRFVV